MEDKVKEYLLLEYVFDHELCSRSLISLCWPYSDIFNFGPNYNPISLMDHYGPPIFPFGPQICHNVPLQVSIGPSIILHWPKYTLRVPIHPNICCGHQMTPMDSNIPSGPHQPQIGPQVSLLGPKWSRSQNEFSFFLVEITFEKPKKSEVENIN